MRNLRFDCCLLSYPHAAPCRACLHLLNNILAGRSRQLSGPCEDAASSCWTSPTPSFSVHNISAWATQWSWWPSIDLTPFYQCLPHAGRWKTLLDVALHMQSNDCWVEMGNHLLWSTDHTPINRSICYPTFLSQILCTYYIPVQHCFRKPST